MTFENYCTCAKNIKNKYCTCVKREKKITFLVRNRFCFIVKTHFYSFFTIFDKITQNLAVSIFSVPANVSKIAMFDFFVGHTNLGPKLKIQLLSIGSTSDVKF